MSFFLASIYDRFMAPMERTSGVLWRRELLAPLRGRVLEIGAGTGRNLERYGAVDRLVVAEPDRHMRAKLARRASALASPAEIVAWTGERLECGAGEFDAVVSTLVLCSVVDVGAVLAEVRRVLAPGGSFVFLEHVLSPDAARRRWQRRVEPLWKLVAGNCNLCRETDALIGAAGFRHEDTIRESAQGALPILRTMVRGSATLAAR